MIVADLLTFFGRLHPVVVHLPIGILILALLLDLYAYRKQQDHFKPTVQLSLLAGFLSAVTACVLGYVLSLSGDYQPDALSRHQYAGIAVAIISGILYLITIGRIKKLQVVSQKLFTALLVTMVGLLSYAGHQGGSLTHGSEYLSYAAFVQKHRPKPGSAQEAYIYEDVVQPMLERRCGQCHEGGKVKGRLSIATIEDLLKGGKNGPAIVPGDPEKSELIKRVSLPPDHDDFMPAEGKTPLTSNDRKILKWWIANAMSVQNKKMSELAGSDSMISRINAYLRLGPTITENEDEMAVPVNPDIPDSLDMKLIDRLREKGVLVRVMLQRPVMLDVTIMPEAHIKIGEITEDLKAVAPNIILFNAADNDLNENDVAFLAECVNLEKLRLEKNPLGDGIADHLSGLKYLSAINLYNTKITSSGVEKLKKLPSIQRIYVWGTKAG